MGFKLNKEQHEAFEQATTLANKILVSTMDELNIPNYIKSKAICDGYEYELNFTKKKIE